MTTQQELTAAARRLHKAIVAHNVQLVFAESCTGGLISATLARIPGISAYLCGSAVVYQKETKSAWLKIPRRLLAKSDAVSSAVAAEMARNVLIQTPQADVAASITGHLGPGAPVNLDGRIYVGLAARNRRRPKGRPKIRVIQRQLSGAGKSGRPEVLRVERQRQAAIKVLLAVRDFLSTLDEDRRPAESGAG